VTLKTIPPTTQAALIASPEVREAIQAVLKRRTVPGADLEDLTHDVIAKALVAPSTADTLEQCKALVTKVANDLAIDSWRRTRRRSKVNVGLYENPDDRPGLAAGASDTVLAREQIAFLQGQVDQGALTDRQAAILARHAEDVPHREIASELQIAQQTVRNELAAGRRVVRASWAAYAGLGALASVSLILCLLHDSDRVLSKSPPIEEFHPDPSASSEGPTPLQLARDQRRDALHACDVGQYQECLDGLDRAAKTDPAGDASPVVQKARQDALQRILEPRVPAKDGHER
jgi:RNA polymerase sigma factor (sigma-70 family)